MDDDVDAIGISSLAKDYLLVSKSKDEKSLVLTRTMMTRRPMLQSSAAGP